jgi:transcriptional regulator with XRE-family HTH domain
MASTPHKVTELLKQEIPAKISLNQFCKKTGINPNSVDKYMAGVAEPNQSSMTKLADYFGVPVAYLRGEVHHISTGGIGVSGGAFSSDADIFEELFSEIANEMKADFLQHNPSKTEQQFSLWLADIKPQIVKKVKDRCRKIWITPAD